MPRNCQTWPKCKQYTCNILKTVSFGEEVKNMKTWYQRQRRCHQYVGGTTQYHDEHLSLVHTCATRHDTTACDTTRFFAPHTIKWISSHICSTTTSGRHDKELRQQKSLWRRFLSCVAATLSRKLLKKIVFIGISPGFNYKFMTQEQSLKSQSLQFQVTQVTGS